MGWHTLFIIFMIFCSSLAQNCDQSKGAALNIIRQKIQQASQNPHQRCHSYGSQNFRNYPDGHTDSHLLRIHYVCTHAVQEHKKLYVEADVQRADMGNGEKVWSQARKDLRWTYDTCKCDEAGHIIPRNLGGSGYFYNLFAQEHHLNMALWNKICNRISKWLTTDNRHVTIKMHFIYDDPAFEFRPSGYYFSFDYYENEQYVRSEYGYLVNENHEGAVLGKCDISPEEKLLYVSNLGNLHITRRTCSPTINTEEYEYGPRSDDDLTILLSRGIQFFG